jgi:transmembrane sensor
MEELIVKYLTDGLKEADKRELKIWLQHKENRQVFEHMIANWKINQSDIEKSRDRVYTKLVGMRPRHVKKQITFSFFMKAAAVLLIIFASVFLFVSVPDTPEGETSLPIVTKIEKHALMGQKLTLLLPDGSLVKLNSGSRLIAPEIFQGDIRKVFLEGEAFFAVAEDSSRPFVVETIEMDVQVLGTSFNVRSYPGEENVSVAVLTGKVMVSDRSDDAPDNQIFLMPEEMLDYSVEEKRFFEKRQFDPGLVLGWKDQQLVFRDETIKNILTTLSRWYNVQFDIKSILDQEREFTASFNNPTLKEVMESISYSFQFDYEIKKDKVFVY